jgi:UDP-sulfoquinovose synthase
MREIRKVMVTGADGYIGVPLMWELKSLGYELVGVDNRLRDKLVKRIAVDEVFSIVAPYGVTFIEGDLADKDFVHEILAIHRPDVIIHLASQPSMPYSQINGERALFTQVNNLSMNINLLWAMKELGLNSKYIITTTTGIPGQFYDVIPETTTENKAGSWYHASRGFDSVNCELANKQWGQEVIEFRTAIVYGVQNAVLETQRRITRFDTDFYFGTVLNRFINQALEGKSLSVYGQGLQKKPFIALRDVTCSLANSINMQFDRSFTVLNQMTEMKSIMELAEIVQKSVGCRIEHVPNPRVEKEDFDMMFENGQFLKVLGEYTTMDSEVPKMVKALREEKSGTMEL